MRPARHRTLAPKRCSNLRRVAQRVVNIVKWTDGKFHLFVSEIANGCGMAAWDTNSFVTHAVSDTVNGTYVKAATAAQHWAHNPQAIVVGSEMFLFHIGPANGNSTLVDCRPQPAVVTRPPRPLFDPQVAYILSAPGPEGPWTEVAGGPLCDNPSPWVMSNGTLLLMCSRSVGYTPGKGVHWRLYSAPSPRGPWNVVKEIFPDMTATRTEDPFLWQDVQGHFHALAQGGPLNEAGQPSPTVSAHAFSRDGLVWGWSAAPYSSIITYEDCTSRHFASAVRPKLLLDGDGNPTHLINGLGPHPWPCNGCPWHNDTNVCNKCKLTPGIDYTYTIMRRLG